MRITNTSRETELASNARAANTFWSRLVGLLGRKSLEPGEALLIEPCSSVHTAFMRFTIDVVYLDKERRVIKMVPRMVPFRASALWRGGHSVVELPAGRIEDTSTSVGDQLAFE